MSDLCLYELADNFWGEFSESDDHMVPQPDRKQGEKSLVEGDSYRKLHNESNGITSNADASSKHRVSGTAKREKQSVSYNGKMIEGQWSHSPDSVSPSRDTELTKGVPSVASEDTMICSHSCKNGNVGSDSCEFCTDDSIMGDGCTADDNTLYPYPLGQMSQSDNDLSFLDNQQEDKDNSDLLYYGWPDIGNFEDVDKMFRSCDSTFGLQNIDDDEDFWFSSSNATGRTEDASKSGLQLSGTKKVYLNDSIQSDNEGLHINASNKKYVSEGNKMSFEKKKYDSTAAPGFLHEIETKPENGDVLTPKEQIKSSKRQPKCHNQLEEERTNQYLQNDVQQHELSGGPDLMRYSQRQCMHLDYANYLDQMSVCPSLSGTKSENNEYPSPSSKDPFYALNKSQYINNSHGLSIEVPGLARSEMGENKHSCLDFQSPFASHSDSATMTNTLVFCGTASNQNKLQHSQNQIEDQTNFKGGNIELSADLDSSNAQDSSCMTTMINDISLEAASFRQLQQAMEKLDVRTKLCIRDSLYRLARSAEQRHNCATQIGVGGNGEDNGADFMDIETDTNPIDRSIAHLLFHRPSDRSRAPTNNDSSSLRPHMNIHESGSSPKVHAEKQICPEEAMAGGENEMLITNDR